MNIFLDIPSFMYYIVTIEKNNKITQKKRGYHAHISIINFL